MKFLQNTKTKIILITISIFTLFVSISGFLIINQQEDQLISHELNSVKITNTSNANQISQIINNNKQLAKSISQQEEVVDFTKQPNSPDPTQINESLKKYLINQEILNIYILNKTGETIASIDNSFQGKNYKFRRYFEHAIEGASYVDAAVGITTNQLGFYISQPIIDPNQNNQPIGVLVIKSSPKSIVESIDNRFEENSEILLSDEMGVIIYSNNSNKIFTTIDQLKDQDINTINTYNLYPNSLKSGSDSELINKLTHYDQPIAYISQNNSNKTISTITKIKDSPFYVIAKVSLDLSQEKIKIIQSFSILATIALVILIIAFIFIIDKVLEPIDKVKNLANNLVEGNPPENYSDLIKEGEFVELANTLISMFNKINQSKANLQKQVDERTKSLNEKTKELEQTLEDFYTMRISMIKDLDNNKLEEENQKIKKRLEELKNS